MKTTKKHFEIFKEECEHWIDRFKIDNWKVYYRHEQISPNTFGSCRTNVAGHVATLYFTDIWETKQIDPSMIEEGIKETAKHEVLHLLLARLSDYATSRNYTSNDCIEAEEELIRKLEKIIK